MGRLYQAAVQFFADDGWHFMEHEDGCFLTMAVSGSTAVWQCRAVALEDQDCFLFYSICPIRAPEELRTRVLELIARINYRLVLGRFDLDIDDGQIIFTTAINVEGDTLTPALIRNLVYANLATMDRFLPSIFALIHGNCSPREALARIEQKTQSASGEESPPPSWWARLFDRQPDE